MTVTADAELARLAAEAPTIPGLRFRRLRLPDDAAGVADVHNRAQLADGLDDLESAADWRRWFEHPSGFDPAVDVVVGELDGRIVSFAQARTEQDSDGGRNYYPGGEVAPELRGRGIGRAQLHHGERRLRVVAATHPPEVEKRFETWAFDSQVSRRTLLESEGYVPVRYAFEMLRPNLSDIPDLPLPDGIEVRPMQPEQYRQVWQAEVEAFRDHWGGMDESEDQFHRHYAGEGFRPELWRVAWDGDEVAGVVAVMILTTLNETTGTRRGLLSGVSVRRPWRRRGLARAMVVESLKGLRDAGMTSAVLGVDAENPTGALGVYEATGFEVARRATTFRKPLEMDR
jgi:mycothiol synthase